MSIWPWAGTEFPQGDGVAFQQFRPVRWIAAARRVRQDHLGPAAVAPKKS